MSFSITGKASNAKGGAIIETDEGVYYVAWKEEWDDEFLGKQVRAQGVHRVEKHDETLNNDGIHSAGMTSDQHFIATTKIELV